jgi:type IV pilus assembly protein PilC
MTVYAYRALDAAGKVVRGNLPATSERELEGRLRNGGLEVLEARPLSARRRGLRGRIARKELISLCFHMEQTLRGGLMVTDALEDLIGSTTDRRLRDTLSSVLESVREGASLSAALSEFPAAFDQVFVGMVAVGEASGQLSMAFAKLGAQLRWADELAAQVKKMMMYPAFTLTVLVGVTLFMMLYLVPQLAGFITQTTGGEIPLNTRILLGISREMVAHWPWLLATPVALAVITLLVLNYSGEALRRQVDAWLLRLPIVGTVLRRVILARFASLLGMLYGAGVPVLQALEVCARAAGNRHLGAGITRVAEEIVQGAPLTEAFRRVELFPSLVLRMVRIGELTGELDQSLSNVGYFYHRDIQEAIAKIQALVEPVMTITLGLLLGWLMMAVLGPIYDLLGKMKI